jgi:FtsP/CotA-like multicopper oxidase with cupredoxin domain
MLRSMSSAALACCTVLVTGSKTLPIVEEIHPNDNRHAAGILAHGVLTVALETRPGSWRPDGEGGRAIDGLGAFAEVGQPLFTPGPLIRVPVGTAVRGTLHNTLGRSLTVLGLGPTRSLRDTLVVAAGATVPFRFKASSPGTFLYTARNHPDPELGRPSEDMQLNGAIVVDAPHSPSDRVMAISWYFTRDQKSPSGFGRGVMAINGQSWPHTERLEYTQGDSIHWRMVNFTEADHPMHLHGFYFRVDDLGNPADTSAHPHMAVTQVLLPFSAMRLSWKADRPGNWIFHCHYAAHLSSVVELDTDRGVLDPMALEHHMSDRPHQMFGLVMGLSVAPKGPAPVYPAPERVIRIVQREKPNGYGDQPGMSYSMEDNTHPADPGAMPVPGPTLILERGKRVQVTIVNQSEDHAAVHWHGIELESYPDGVPGWSGSGTNILKPIAPHDSLTVRWTPPRAGSFMYHSHFSELKQMGAGLYGPIIVLAPGERFDPATDRVLFFGTAGAGVNFFDGPFPKVILNGSAQPAPMELKAGTRYRFRLFNLAGDSPTQVSLNQDGTPVPWRAVAKDGYPLPASLAVSAPAMLVFDPGEIYDFEFTPNKAGELTLKFGIPDFFLPPPPKPGDPPPPPSPFGPTVTVMVHVR